MINKQELTSTLAVFDEGRELLHAVKILYYEYWIHTEGARWQELTSTLAVLDGGRELLHEVVCGSALVVALREGGAHAYHLEVWNPTSSPSSPLRAHPNGPMHLAPLKRVWDHKDYATHKGGECMWE
jgi:hypothetical protein